MKKINIMMCLLGLSLLIYSLSSAVLVAFALDETEESIIQTDVIESTIFEKIKTVNSIENVELENTKDEELESTKDEFLKSEETENTESIEFHVDSSISTEMMESDMVSVEQSSDVEEKESNLIRSTSTIQNLYGTIIEKNYQLFSDKELEYDISTQYDLVNKTIHIGESFIDRNEERYYSIADNQNWLGYIHEKYVHIASGDQGVHQNYGKYVSIKGSYAIWNGFAWEKSVPGSQYKNQTLQARGIYHHFNGSRYLSLYDNKGQWLGYMNELGTTLGNGDQGAYLDYGKYVSIKGNYDIWDDFGWKNKTQGIKYKNQTLQARGVYNHFNGSSYFSLYNNQGMWIGYINKNGTSLAQGSQGVYQRYEKYVTVKSKDYSIWRDFKWSSKSKGNHLGKRYLAKGVYNHFNGIRYLSLYDTKGKWIGYINGHETNDTYQYWSKKGDNWYYFSNEGTLTKGWGLIDSKWHFFDNTGIHLDTNQTQFISDNIFDVLRVTKENKLYPSIMLAQSILESGYGSSELAKNANNFFGMKFKKNEDEGKYGKYDIKTKEYDSEKNEMITIVDTFRKYSTKLQSFEDNALKLRQGVSWDEKYYAGTWRENSKSYKEVSKALTSRYATDPEYYKKLDSIIEKWKLNQFD